MGLKNLRIKNGYSQEKLASLSNLSTRTIQRIERENKASFESINALSKVLKLEAKELEQHLNLTSDINIEENDKNQITFLDYLLNNKKTIRFMFINIFLIIINLVTNYENLWFPYILIGWGSFHFYKRYIGYKSIRIEI